MAAGDVAAEHGFGVIGDILAAGAATLRDDAAFGEEEIGQRDRFVERAAGVGAQIEHQPVDPAGGFRFHFFPRCKDIAADIAGKFIDHDLADIALMQFPGDRFEFDHAALHRKIEGFVAARTEDGELDRGTLAASHLRDRFIELLPHDQPPIEMGDEIAGLDPRNIGRAAAERRDHLHRAVFRHDGEAQARIIAVDHRFEPLQIAAVEIARMRIERGQHAIDHAAHQRFIVDRVDIARLDPLVDPEDLREFGPRAAIDLRHAGCGRGNQRDGGHECGRTGESGEFHGREDSFAQANLSPVSA